MIDEPHAPRITAMDIRQRARRVIENAQLAYDRAADGDIPRALDRLNKARIEATVEGED